MVISRRMKAKGESLENERQLYLGREFVAGWELLFHLKAEAERTRTEREGEIRGRGSMSMYGICARKRIVLPPQTVCSMQ